MKRHGPEYLKDDALAAAVFKKLHSVGQIRTNGQIVQVADRNYAITASQLCRLELIHVVTKCVETASLRAMVFLHIYENGYPGSHGAEHLMPALMDGIFMPDHPAAPGNFYWRVLPFVDAPPCFTPRETD